MKFSRWIRYAREEGRFIRSPVDILNLSRKLPYFIRRLCKRYCRTWGLPLSLQIEPTNHCNISCICCGRPRMKRERHYMDPRLFCSIIDDAASNGIGRVHLYLHGEPFLHPALTEMIRHAKLRGLGITIATNGMLLDRRTIEDLLHAGMDSADHIIFSILGYSREVHERIMLGVDHDRVIKNILDFLEARKAHDANGPILETVMYTMPENAGEEQQFVAYWQCILDHVRDPVRISNQFAGKSVSGELKLRSKLCRDFWERMTVYWNGDVALCCEDLNGTHILGNLKESSIRDVWEGEKMQTLKNLHRKKQFAELPLCARCDM